MYSYKAKVISIIDGDTMDLLIDIGFDIHIKERVRLFGVDCPECRTKDLEEKKRGLAAMEYVCKMLKDVKGCIEITTHKQKKGKFGRYLVEVWLNELDMLNDMLIESGNAQAYFGKKKEKYSG